MFTPQQIEQISFAKATFGGYDMQAVDEFLEPLTEDYITLYKENAVLKSKMKVLVEKLEEYRAQEQSMRKAIVSAQRTADAADEDNPDPLGISPYTKKSNPQEISNPFSLNAQITPLG